MFLFYIDLILVSFIYPHETKKIKLQCEWKKIID